MLPLLKLIFKNVSERIKNPIKKRIFQRVNYVELC